MISSAFKSATQQEFAGQGQDIGAGFKAAKEYVGFAASMFGIGRVAAMGASAGSAAVEAVSAEKIAVAEEQAMRDKIVRGSAEELGKAVESAVKANPQNLDALTTVWEKLEKQRAQKEAETAIMEAYKKEGEEE